MELNPDNLIPMPQDGRHEKWEKSPHHDPLVNLVSLLLVLSRANMTFQDWLIKADIIKRPKNPSTQATNSATNEQKLSPQLPTTGLVRRGWKWLRPS